MPTRSRWLVIRKPLTPTQELELKVLAFVVPLAIWCLVSYCPYVWHPQMRITDGGDSYLAKDMLIDKAPFAEENARMLADGKRPAEGYPANPIFFPAPHKVAKAFYTAFTTAPARNGDLWLHQSLWTSIEIIFLGFSIAVAIAVPLGILCGNFGVFSGISEPFVDFIRYMPAPAFGALAVAILGIDSGPKIAIIFIGSFFPMVLVVANTTRQLDASLLEAAQTLGAGKRRLITRVIIPGILPNLYTDMRILLGCAWTYLLVAELTGAKSGISAFIQQQGNYRHYENVYAGIIMIGMVGLLTDQTLAWLAPRLFPWTAEGTRVKPLRVLPKLHRLFAIVGSNWDEKLPWRKPAPGDSFGDTGFQPVPEPPPLRNPLNEGAKA